MNYRNPDLRDIIRNRGLLLEMIENGFIRKQNHPTEPLFILNYTEKATFGREWNVATLTCRGLIVNSQTYEVEARPFPKFFNWNEPNAPTIEPDVPVWVTDKMDGSLGIRYWQPRAKKWAIATRGSFTSEQAIHATKRLDDYYGGHHAAPERDDYRFTKLFEIIYPENRIVLQYGDLDMLVALGGVEKSTGLVYPVTELNQRMYSDLGFETPLVFGCADYKTALSLKPRANAEGVVVVTKNDSCQVMVKIKQDDYVALHKTITGLNDRVIWERIGNGDDLAEIEYGVPEEFWPYIETVWSELTEQADTIADAVLRTYDVITRKLEHDHGQDWSRKDFAVLAKQFSYADLLFRKLDNKTLSDVIWKKLKPAHTAGPMRTRNTEED